MKLIRHRDVVEHVEYQLAFDYEGEPKGSGFAFPCAKGGAVDVDALREAARSSLARCLFGTMRPPVVYRGVREFRHRYIEPAIGCCSCGAEVELAHFTNICPGCSRDYNSAGRELAPREQWGEETGEHPADIAWIR